MTQAAGRLRVVMDMTLVEGRMGGSAVYAQSLLAALRLRDDVEIEVVTSPGPGGALATARWMVAGESARVRASGAAVLHSPAYLAPLRPPVPMVLTIHDLSLSKMPEGHPLEWRMYYRFLLPRLARKAAAVITPTETTRRDVVAAFHVARDRVAVVPYGVTQEFFAAGKRDRSAAPANPTLIVFPGPPIGRKNLDLVLGALAGAPKGSATAAASLAITGAAEPDFPAYQRRIRELGLGDRVTWLGRLDFEEIPALYARADVLAYPSFLEGFGFPPLEAMAAGTPVVASNASCLPEVLGDAALLVDPRDAAGFTAAVESLLTNASLRLKQVAAGEARARTFTWERCAEETVTVYRRAAGIDPAPAAAG